MEGDPAALNATDGFTPQTISANRGPVYEFMGRLLAQHSTQNAKRTKTRWTELRLWETPAGAWVVEHVGCSDDDGHVDIADVAVFPRHKVGREFAVMDTLEWSYAARALASKMKWDLKVRVE
ncbi:MAG: hypothetical protein DI547_05065 [Sphingobium sp.]|nr:MAG: hypothetical protein DI547_05065 [Sphingobium sp.]